MEQMPQQQQQQQQQQQYLRQRQKLQRLRQQQLQQLQQLQQQLRQRRQEQQEQQEQQQEQLQLQLQQQQLQPQQQERCLPISVDSLTCIESPPGPRDLRRRSREGIHIRSSSSSLPWSSSSTDVYTTTIGPTTLSTVTEANPPSLDDGLNTAEIEAGSLSRECMHQFLPVLARQSSWDGENTSMDPPCLSQRYPSPPPVPPCSPVVLGCPKSGKNNENCQRVYRNAGIEKEDTEEDHGKQREYSEPSKHSPLWQLTNICEVVAKQTEDIRSLHDSLLRIWSQRSQAIAAVATDPADKSADD